MDETATSAIEHAESLLPGIPSPAAESDPRWQAIIQIGYFIESDPEEVWQFVVRWGPHEQEDLRDAVACCLLEHLLEYHFETIFPRVEELTARNLLFADCFTRCWKFGQAKTPEGTLRFDSLQADCRQRIAECT